MGVWLGPMAKAATGLQFEIPGVLGTDYLYTTSGSTWEIALLTKTAASVLFRSKPGTVRVFAVGGGASGGAAVWASVQGGGGGNGGETVDTTFTPARRQSYAMVVGNGGEATTAFGGQITAASGGRANTGAGGGGAACDRFSGYGAGNPGIGGSGIILLQGTL